jgi:hypothetical protein
MSQPTPPGPAMQVQLSVTAEPAGGPDGTAWVKLTLHYGLSKHVVLCPAELIDDLAPKLRPVLHEAAANARRANMGLILPGNGNGGSPPMPPGGPRG